VPKALPSSGAEAGDFALVTADVEATEKLNGPVNSHGLCRNNFA
jgi:hypothetical protein